MQTMQHFSNPLNAFFIQIIKVLGWQ